MDQLFYRHRQYRIGLDRPYLYWLIRQPEEGSADHEDALAESLFKFSDAAYKYCDRLQFMFGAPTTAPDARRGNMRISTDHLVDRDQA